MCLYDHVIKVAANIWVTVTQLTQIKIDSIHAYILFFATQTHKIYLTARLFHLFP